MVSALRHQHDRAGDADHDPAATGCSSGCSALEVNSEYQYPKYFSMLPARRRPGASFSRGFFELAAAAEPEAEDARDRRRRRRIPAQRRRRRARERQGSRPQDRLRQDLSAEHHRLHADRAGDRGGQPRARVRRLLPAGFGRHGARRPRGRAEDEAVRRRHGRAAIASIKQQLGPHAERHRQLRLVAAGREDAVSRRRGIPQEISGAGPRPRASIRSASICRRSPTPTCR